jgi:hypothetical protein
MASRNVRPIVVLLRKVIIMDTKIINSPADWRGAEMAVRKDWIYYLNSDEISEIDSAFQQTMKNEIEFSKMTKENFPLPRFSEIAAHGRDVLENGPGLFHIRGFPSLNYTAKDLRRIYWGLGKHIGTAVCQSSDGDVLGDVRNINVDINGPKGRGYKTNQKLSFHSDSCDVAALFVLRVARSGGLSMLASSVAIRNEIARTRPDLLEALYTPYQWSLQGQEKPGQMPYYPQPIYSEHQGNFSSRLVRAHIDNAQKIPGAPRLSSTQIEAIDLVRDLAESEEFNFKFMFEPGDIQLLNNHVTLHSRTEFVDFEEPEHKRHLLRMWLSVPNSRSLSKLMSPIFKNQIGGTVRGGFPALTEEHIYETPMPN